MEAWRCRRTMESISGAVRAGRRLVRSGHLKWGLHTRDQRPHRGLLPDPSHVLRCISSGPAPPLAFGRRVPFGNVEQLDGLDREPLIRGNAEQHRRPPTGGEALAPGLFRLYTHPRRVGGGAGRSPSSSAGPHRRAGLCLVASGNPVYGGCCADESAKRFGRVEWPGGGLAQAGLAQTGATWSGAAMRVAASAAVRSAATRCAGRRMGTWSTGALLRLRPLWTR
jgi:hypothetical protein